MNEKCNITKPRGTLYSSIYFEDTSVYINPLSANTTKLSNTLKTIRRQESTNCLGVFDHFLRLALKRLTWYYNFKLNQD